MTPDDWLIVAPFVVEHHIDGGQVLVTQRSGRERRQGVRLNERLTELLKHFEAGANRESVTLQFPQQDHPELRAAIETLKQANILIGADELVFQPPSIELEITNRCNADCIMCPRVDLRSLGSMDERTFAAVERLAYEGCSGAIFQGIGEPTLHIRLVEWVTRIRKAVPSDAPVVVVTNGARLKPELFAELIEAGVSLIQVSLHSTDADESNEIMRWKKHDVVVDNLRMCAQRDPDRLAINMVVADTKDPRIEAMRTWMSSIGIDPLRLGVIPQFSRGSFIVNRLTTPNHQEGRCLYVQKSIFIAWNGDVLPCSNDIRGSFVMGNLNDMSTGDALHIWWRELVTLPVAFDICRTCDHHSRSSVPTEWFKLAREQTVGMRR